MARAYVIAFAFAMCIFGATLAQESPSLPEKLVTEAIDESNQQSITSNSQVTELADSNKIEPSLVSEPSAESLDSTDINLETVSVAVSDFQDITDATAEVKAVTEVSINPQPLSVSDDQPKVEFDMRQPEETNETSTENNLNEPPVATRGEQENIIKPETPFIDSTTALVDNKEVDFNNKVYPITVIASSIAVIAIVILSVYYRLYVEKWKKAPFEAPWFVQCFFPRPRNYEHEMTELCAKYFNN